MTQNSLLTREIKKVLSAFAVTSILFANMQLGVLPAFEPIVEKLLASQSTILPPALENQVLATLMPGMPSSLTLGADQNPFTVRGEVNAKFAQFGLPQIPTDYNNSGALRRNTETLRATCNLFGYATVLSSESVWAGDGRSNFTSCHDNKHAVWNGSTMNIQSACGGQWTSKLVCSDPLLPPVPECQDGRDNDGDGVADSADFGCQVGTKESEPLAQCQDGRDNDNDGTVDSASAIVTGTPALGGSSYTIATRDPFAVRTFVNSKAAEYGYPTVSDTSALYNDSATALRICQMAGYSHVQNVDCSSSFGSGCGYSTPFNNGMVKWNGTTFQAISALNNNRWIASLTCDQPIQVLPCQDGIDNDGDSRTDMQDPDCTSPNHTSELPADPQCQTPQDNDESPADRPDLRITKTPLAPFVMRGQPIGYQITVVNAGTVPALMTRVTDRIPSGGLTFNAAASTPGCVQEGSDIKCSLGALAVNQQANITVSFNTPAVTTSCSASTITNTASVTSSNQDANGSDNSVTAQSVPLTCPPTQCSDQIDNDGDTYIDFPQDLGCTSPEDNDESPDNRPNFTITKTASTPSVIEGSNVQFTITVKNVGSASQSNVQIKDQPGPGLTFVSASPSSCTLQGAEVVCAPETFAVGAQKTYTLTFTAMKNQTCTPGALMLQNMASVSVGGALVSATASPASVALQCLPQCSDGRDNDNDGSTDSSDFSCSSPTDDDELNPKAQCQDGVDNDGDLLVDSADPRCHSDNNPSNQASYTPQDNDESPNDAPNFTITKTGPATVTEDATVSYVVTVKNNGSIAQSNIQVIDQPGAGLTFVSSNASQCSLQGSQILCAPETFNTGEQKAYTLNFRVNKASVCTPGQSVQNTASVLRLGAVIASLTTPVQSTVQCLPQCNDGRDNDGDGATDYSGGDFSCSSPTDDDETNLKAQCQDGNDNDSDGLKDFPQDPGCTSLQDNDETHVVMSDLYISKEGPIEAERGGIARYTLTATNMGPGIAEHVALTDNIPSGLTFLPAESSTNCVLLSGTVVCDNLTLAMNQSASVTVAFRIGDSIACNASITNTAAVSTASVDPSSDNNRDETTMTVRCPSPTFSLQKTDGRTSAAPGTQLVYTMTVTNTSSVPATNVVLTDVLPPTVSFFSADGGGIHSGGAVSWTIASLAPGASVQRTATVRVLPSAVIGSDIVNRAYILNIVAEDHTTVLPSSSPACSDGIDNDSDSLIDFPSDPGCTSASDDDETNAPAIELSSVTVNGCNVSVTYRKQSQTCAHLLSTGTLSPLHTQNFFCATEATVTRPLTDFLSPFAVGASVKLCDGNNYGVCSTPVTVTGGGVCSFPQCRDGIDNDNDGHKDYPEDLSCTSPDDPTEDTDDRPNIIIAKTGPGTVTEDGTITYDLKVKNIGQFAQSGLQVFDQPSAGLTFQTSNPAQCHLQGTIVVCDPLSLAPNEEKGYQITFKVVKNPVCIPGQIVQNTASVFKNGVSIASVSSPVQSTVECLAVCRDGRDNDGDGATDYPADFSCSNANDTDEEFPKAQCQDNQDNDGDGLIDAQDPGCMNGGVYNPQDNDEQNVANADLVITKIAPPSVVQGQNIVYTIRVTNVGPNQATNVQVQDKVPEGLTFIEGAPSYEGCVLSTTLPPTVLCNHFSLAPNETKTIPVAFNVARTPQTQVCSTRTISNVATVTSLANEMNPTDNTSATVTQATCPEQFANVSIVKSGPSSVLFGSNSPVVYTVTVFNAGPDTAEGVTVNDPVPAHLVFDPAHSDSVCRLNGTTVLCDNTRIFAGSSKTFFIAFTAPIAQGSVCTPDIVRNTASVSTSSTDLHSGDNTSTTVESQGTCPVPLNADLSLEKSGPVQPVQHGDTVTYLLTVKNNGPAVSQGITVTDTIPAGFTFVPSPLNDCAKQGNTVVCHAPALQSGDTTTLVAHFQTPALTPGAVCTPEPVSNTATVTSSTPDLVQGNNASTVTITLGCPAEQRADLSVTKYGPTTVTAGTSVTHTIVASNMGPNTAQNVVITDQIPAGFSFVSASGPGITCAPQGPIVRCTAPTLASGQVIAPIAITLAVPSTQPCPSSVTNIAQVASDTVDPVSANNQSQVVIDVQCAETPRSDLAVQISGPASAQFDTPITYTFIAYNRGPAVESQAVIRVPVPANAEFQSTSGIPSCAIEGSELVCRVGSLASGASTPLGTLTLIVRSAQPVAMSHSWMSALIPTANASGVCTPGSIVMTSSVAGTNSDPVSTNNQSSVTTALTCPSPTTADLSIVKSGPTTPVTFGSTVSYTLTVTNNGPATVSSVTASDTFPPELTYVSVSGATCMLALPAGATGSTPIGGMLTCDVGTLASGASKVITLNFSTSVPTVCAQKTVTNNSAVTENDATVTDPNSANNASSLGTTLTCPSPTTADLSIVKSGADSIIRGQNGEYTLTVTNLGPASLTNTVSIDDTLPAGLTYVSSVFSPAITGATCSYISSTRVVHCTAPSLAVNATAIVKITVTADTVNSCTASTSITNTATVSESDALITDPVTTNNTATKVTALTCPTPTTADLSIVKTGADAIVRGQNGEYTLTVTNLGPAPLTNTVSIDDTLPAGLTYVSAIFNPAISGATCDYTSATRLVHCTAPNLAVNATAVVKITVTADTVNSCTASTSITNTATVSESDALITDPVTTNNTATKTTTLTCPGTQIVDLSVTKSGPSSLVRGTNGTYTFVITNAGPATVSSLKLVDTITVSSGTSPMTYVSSSVSGGMTGSCSLVGSNVECPLTGTLSAGQTATVTLVLTAPTVTTACSAVTVSDTASVTETDSSVTETNTSNNSSSTLSTNVTCTGGSINDLTITKSHSPSTPTVGQYVRYTLTITNSNASQSLTNLTVTDPLQSGLTYLWSSDGGSLNGSSVTWTGISVPPSGSRMLYIDATVTGTSQISNTATVTATDGTKTSNTDTFTPQPLPTYPQPPVYPPVYPPQYPPSYPQPPVYSPQYPQPPVSYPPMTYPTPTYPTTPVVYPTTPTYVMPTTGAAGDLFAKMNDKTQIVQAKVSDAVQDHYPTVYYATIVALLALLSAGATKIVTSGILF